jgi:predicted nucleic acid-binding protein
LPTSKRPERLVVDANPILSALLGGSAKRIFFETGIREFGVPYSVLDEVRAHIPLLALKLGVGKEFLLYALDLLPLNHYTSRVYHQAIIEARRRIEHRDPNDVDVLALTLSLNIPLWTNDRDFEDTGIEWITTAKLLALFFGKSAH